MLKLYTKTICPKCLWVKSELDQTNLQVELINIDHSTQGMQEMIAAGFSAVPILQANGEWFSSVPEIIAHIEKLAQ